MAIHRDITERKKAEERLSRSEERLQLAVYSANLGIFEHDQRTDVLYWSPTLRDIFGVGPDEPASLPAYIELIHRDDRDERVAAIRRAHDPAGEGLDTFEHRIIRRDGSVRWVHCCARTFFEGDAVEKRPVRTVGTVADITEQKQAEEMRDRLAAIVESAEDAIISKTLDGILTSWNAGAERLLGYSAKEVIGKSNSMILPVDRQEEEPQLLKQIALGKSIEHYETVRLHKSGRRVDVVLSLSPVRDSAERVTGCAKIMHDISARRLLEKEVLEIAIREQRRIGQELHDSTGQELTALSLLADTLVKALEGRASAETSIARKLAGGLQRTLGKIRGIARGLVPVEVDSQGLLAALDELATRVNSSCGVTCTFNSGGTAVDVNDNQTATHLFHIAQEAVTNSLRHGKSTRITITLVKEDQAIALRIEDNGVGCPKEPFESKGMGLKIMHYRACLINSRLTVGQADPVGTAVMCRLFNRHEP